MGSLKTFCFVCTWVAALAVASGSIQLTDRVRDKFVTAHNNLRRLAGSPDLVWSKRLARLAGNFTDECDLDKDIGRRPPENRFAVYEDVDKPLEVASIAVEFWHTQIQNGSSIFRLGSISYEFLFDGECSCCGRGKCFEVVTAQCERCQDYIIGKNNIRLGCAITNCQEESKTLVACKYDKRGKKGRVRRKLKKDKLAKKVKRIKNTKNGKARKMKGNKNKRVKRRKVDKKARKAKRDKMRKLNKGAKRIRKNKRAMKFNKEKKNREGTQTVQVIQPEI